MVGNHQQRAQWIGWRMLSSLHDIPFVRFVILQIKPYEISNYAFCALCVHTKQFFFSFSSFYPWCWCCRVEGGTLAGMCMLYVVCRVENRVSICNCRRIEWKKKKKECVHDTPGKFGEMLLSGFDKTAPPYLPERKIYAYAGKISSKLRVTAVCLPLRQIALSAIHTHTSYRCTYDRIKLAVWKKNNNFTLEYIININHSMLLWRRVLRLVARTQYRISFVSH